MCRPLIAVPPSGTGAVVGGAVVVGAAVVATAVVGAASDGADASSEPLPHAAANIVNTPTSAKSRLNLIALVLPYLRRVKTSCFRDSGWFGP